MSKKMTSKKPQFGHNRSHALNATAKKWRLNLQKITLADGRKVKLTAREIKNLKKAEKN